MEGSRVFAPLKLDAGVNVGVYAAADKLVAGGLSYEPQIKALNKGIDILVGTPGRLADLMERGAVELGDAPAILVPSALGALVGAQVASVLPLGLLQPLLLGSNVRDDNTFLMVDLTNPDIYENGQHILPKDTVHIVRTSFIWNDQFYTRFGIQNHGGKQGWFHIFWIFHCL